MRWFKKFLRGVFALILIFSLLSLALSTSLDTAFSSPNHLKTWATDSTFYSALISKASADTASGLGNPELQAEINPIISKSLKNAFPKSQFNNDVNTFIDSNYAWLQGKTTKPEFVINVTPQKQAFASQLGNYVTEHYQNLPACTYSELANLSGASPLTLACQVPISNDAQIYNEVVSEVDSTNILVKNTVITASNITQSNNKPYYQAFNAPTVYKHLKVAPFIAAVVSLICIFGIFFCTSRKRKALLALSFCFAVSGIILVILSASANTLYSKATAALAKHSGLGLFTSPTENVIHKAIYYINGINLWFGLGYLVVALILIVLRQLKVRHSRTQKSLDYQKDTAPIAPRTRENKEQSQSSASSSTSLPTAPELKTNNKNTD